MHRTQNDEVLRFWNNGVLENPSGVLDVILAQLPKQR
ncbi:MAG: DUF559 domain-containing protein [Alphaproteobacteria bacterium]|nr:DUF559 domain-containing protein [Alphaproteobacteria bacterium]